MQCRSAFAAALAGIPHNLYNYAVSPLTKGWNRGLFLFVLVELMEKYAAAPTYGAQTTVTVSLNFKTLSAAGAEDSEITSLIDTILPVE